ncbi:MAG: hypothetical protein ACI39C_14960 [Dietzia sp.]
MKRLIALAVATTLAATQFFAAPAYAATSFTACFRHQGGAPANGMYTTVRIWDGWQFVFLFNYYTTPLTVA